MPILKWLKPKCIPSVYFVAPQEWHWGTEKGGRNVCDLVTKILAIFRDEDTFYRQLGGNVDFVGNPIMDVVAPGDNEADFRADLGLDDRPILGVFPGSRPQEFKRVAPILMDAAQAISDLYDYQVVVSLSSEKFKDRVSELIQPYGWPLYQGNSRSLIYFSALSLVTSGTVSTEHAVLGTPAIVAYKINPVTYAIGSRLLQRRLGRLPYIAMVNELNHAKLMPEFMQNEATRVNLVTAAKRLISDSAERDKLQDAYVKTRYALGDPGCFKKSAEAIINLLNDSSR